MGDTTICSGRVVGKREIGIHHVIDLEIWSTNQRGEITAPGTATVILPTRASKAIVLPPAPDDMMARGAGMMQAAAERR
jgi:hypothetical protein